MLKELLLISLFLVCSREAFAAKVFITSGSSWAGVATDGSNITVECIGGGGGGTDGAGGAGANGIIVVTYTPPGTSTPSLMLTGVGH